MVVKGEIRSKIPVKTGRKRWVVRRNSKSERVLEGLLLRTEESDGVVQGYLAEARSYLRHKIKTHKIMTPAWHCLHNNGGSFGVSWSCKRLQWPIRGQNRKTLKQLTQVWYERNGIVVGRQRWVFFGFYEG